MNIETLKSQVKNARRVLSEAEALYHAALVAEHPLKVGDVIISSKGALARVDNVFAQHGYVKVFAVMQNKNGLFGSKPASLWKQEWHNPEKVEL